MKIWWAECFEWLFSNPWNVRMARRTVWGKSPRDSASLPSSGGWTIGQSSCPRGLRDFSIQVYGDFWLRDLSKFCPALVLETSEIFSRFMEISAAGWKLILVWSSCLRSSPLSWLLPLPCFSTLQVGSWSLAIRKSYHTWFLLSFTSFTAEKVVLVQNLGEPHDLDQKICFSILQVCRFLVPCNSAELRI